MARPDPFGWVGGAIDDRYAIESIAGDGGQGIVYRARHLGFDVPVAVKCLLMPPVMSDDDRAQFLASFKNEARLLHRLSQRTTGIIQALDVGAACSPSGVWTPYMVMEWLEGITLEQLIEERAHQPGPMWSITETIQLLTPAALALSVAHNAQVSHRDVKPTNLFVVGDPMHQTIKVLDFGIAKVLSDSATLSGALLRQSGSSLQPFTPQYGAPEQFNRRMGETGPWTDVYALALILIEVASGVRALSGSDPIQLYIASANHQQRPTLAEHEIEAPSEVEAILARALAVDPRERFLEAGSMWQQLREAAGLPTLSVTASGVQSVPSLFGVDQKAPTSKAPAEAAQLQVPVDTGSGTDRTVQVRSVARQIDGGEHRICTVVSAELSGLDALVGVLEPSELKRVAQACMRTMTEHIEELNGTVDGCDGASMVAVFGLTLTTANDAERAVCAALNIKRALEQLNAELPSLRYHRLAVRVGVDTGRVYACAASERGVVGTRQVTGEPVQRALRLRQRAPDDAVVIGRDTYRQVASLFRVERLAPLHQNAAGHTIAYCVLGPARRRRTIRSPRFHGLSTKFVGRSATKGRFDELLEAVVDEASAQLLTVVGTAGAGRTRLLAELSRQLDDQNALVLSAQCSELQTDISYGLAASLLRAWFDIHDDDPTDVAIAKLQRGIGQLLQSGTLDSTPPSSAAPMQRPRSLMDIEDVIRQLGLLLGTERPSVRTTSARALMLPDEGGEGAKNRITRAVGRLLAIVGTPVVLLCDDIQWADDASLDLLDELTVRLDDVPLMVVCTARPTLRERRPHWGEGRDSHDTIELKAMSKRQLEKMARNHLRRVEALDPELPRRLAEHAEGSPLTLVDTLHLLIDAEAIHTPQGAAWTIDASRLQTLGLPATIQGIVQARIDRLSDVAREVLARAAVVGRTFWDGALLALGGTASEREHMALTLTLAQLRERRLVGARERSSFPDEKEFVFVESAVQHVAYQSISLKTRRALHHAAAEWLEQRAQNAGAAGLVATHYEHAGEIRLAARTYYRAGVRAAELGQHAEALRHFERVRLLHDLSAGKLSPERLAEDDCAHLRGVERPADGRVASWSERAQLLLDVGDVLRRSGKLDEARATYERIEQQYHSARGEIIRQEKRAGATLREADVTGWDARIDYRLALLAQLQGDVEQAQELVELAIKRANTSGASEEIAPMWALLAALLGRQGEQQRCLEASLEGLRVCRTARVRSGRWREAVSELLITLGGVFYNRKQLVQAVRCYLQSSRMVSQQDNPLQAARALNNVAGIRFFQGDLAGARAAFGRVAELAERSGDLQHTAIVFSNLAEVELALGNATQARRHARRAVRLGEQAQMAADLPDIYRNLACALRDEGELSKALKAGRRALSLASVGGGRFYLGAVAQTLAELISQARTLVGEACQDAVLGHDAGLAEQVQNASLELVQVLDEHELDDKLSAVVGSCRELLQ